ncbi:DHHC palmitoyltransferase-domain-containing protein [Pyronema omphalodes]|nr:DHHC palmitoyltransferase-domain-containing protein [Pyronema omphalodes]
MGQHRRTLNIWVAYFMPVLMLGVIGFATWVFLDLVCVRYLIQTHSRHKTATGLIIVYSILLLLLLLSYLRIVTTLTFNPGYVKRGPAAGKKKRRNRKNKRTLEKAQVDGPGSLSGGEATEDEGNDSDDAEDVIRDQDDMNLDTEGGFGFIPPGTGESTASALPNAGPPFPAPASKSATPAPPTFTQSLAGFLSPNTARAAKDAKRDAKAAKKVASKSNPYRGSWQPIERPQSSSRGSSNLAEFLELDCFVCESDGLPRYCTTCDCWKPDRSHHCSEVGRCVMRMDHFCPWVGGVVAETSFRYFYQVVVYGMLYCGFIIVTLAFLVHEKNVNTQSVDGKWIATIALASLFGLFSLGMTLSTTQLILGNISTVDSLAAKTKVYQLALLDPLATSLGPSAAGIGPVYNPVTDEYVTTAVRVWLPHDPKPGEQQKCYAIVKTERGENPWKLQGWYPNFKESLGGPWYTWGLWWGVPKAGTTGGRTGAISGIQTRGWYRFNEDIIRRLRKEAGIKEPERTL